MVSKFGDARPASVYTCGRGSVPSDRQNPEIIMNKRQENRFDRQLRFFGRAGQKRIQSAKVAVVGVGGLGTHVVQQLSLLGVKKLSLVDAQELDETNLNRYVGARHDDP